MFRAIVFSLLLLSICLSLVTGAEARLKSFEGGLTSVSGGDVGSGR